MALIIDGHNLIGALPDINLGDPQDEARLLERLRMYRAHAGGQPIIVFFDSGDLPGETPAVHLSDAGLQVRFAEPGQSADDAIVEYLAGRIQPGQYAVVTNDHELAHRARMAGASTLSATAFAGRLRRQPPSAKPLPAQEPNPHDPAFADIYERFVTAEKLQLEQSGSRPEASAVELAAWIERIYDDDIEQVQQAAAWLGLHNGPGALAALQDALTHSDVRVRAAALLALGNLGEPAAVDALSERLLHDPASMAREAAAQSLGRLAGRSAEAALETAAQKDTKSKVRKAAQEALAQIRARHR